MERVHSLMMADGRPGGPSFTSRAASISSPRARTRMCIVVGAGLSGLQAARALLTAGVDVQILEQQSDVGGIWLKKSNAYGHDASWGTLTLPDFPVPPEMAARMSRITGRDVVAYLRMYAMHFGLYERIHFNTRMREVRQELDYKWAVSYSSGGAVACCIADFLILATGSYYTPAVPYVQDKSMFAGEQMHVRDFPGPLAASGKHVIIVGEGKEAQDCAMELHKDGGSSSITCVFKQAHWPLPPSALGTPARPPTTGRLVRERLQPYYTSSAWRKATNKIFRNPVTANYWATLKAQLRKEFRLSSDLAPEGSFGKDLFADVGQVADAGWAELLRRGQIKAIKGQIARLDATHALLKDGQKLPASLIIYCTGYAKDYDFFAPFTQQQLGLQKDGLYLYRHMVMPNVRNLAFLGCEASTGNAALTGALQAKWLLAVFNGDVKLPSEAVMREDIRAQALWRREVLPAHPSRSSLILWYAQSYHRQLRDDLTGLAARPPPSRLFACFSGGAAPRTHDDGVGGGNPLFIHVPTILPGTHGVTMPLHALPRSPKSFSAAKSFTAYGVGNAKSFSAGKSASAFPAPNAGLAAYAYVPSGNGLKGCGGGNGLGGGSFLGGGSGALSNRGNSSYSQGSFSTRATSRTAAHSRRKAPPYNGAGKGGGDPLAHSTSDQALDSHHSAAGGEDVKFREDSGSYAPQQVWGCALSSTSRLAPPGIQIRSASSGNVSFTSSSRGGVGSGPGGPMSSGNGRPSENGQSGGDTPSDVQLITASAATAATGHAQQQKSHGIASIERMFTLPSSSSQPPPSPLQRTPPSVGPRMGSGDGQINGSGVLAAPTIAAGARHPPLLQQSPSFSSTFSPDNVSAARRLHAPWQSQDPVHHDPSCSSLRASPHAQSMPSTDLADNAKEPFMLPSGSGNEVSLITGLGSDSVSRKSPGGGGGNNYHQRSISGRVGDLSGGSVSEGERRSRLVISTSATTAAATALDRSPSTASQPLPTIHADAMSAVSAGRLSGNYSISLSGVSQVQLAAEQQLPVFADFSTSGFDAGGRFSKQNSSPRTAVMAASASISSEGKVGQNPSSGGGDGRGGCGRNVQGGGSRHVDADASDCDGGIEVGVQVEEVEEEDERSTPTILSPVQTAALSTADAGTSRVFEGLSSGAGAIICAAEMEGEEVPKSGVCAESCFRKDNAHTFMAWVNPLMREGMGQEREHGASEEAGEERGSDLGMEALGLRPLDSSGPAPGALKAVLRHCPANDACAQGKPGWCE